MQPKAKAPAEVLQDQGKGEKEDNEACTDNTSSHLALKQFDWGHPNALQVQWLTSQGVSFDALLHPWPIGATRIRFDEGRFDIDAKGKDALTFVCFDGDEPIDICAWQPKTGEIASYTGSAIFLGDEDDIFNPASWFGGDDLLVHSTPLEWLRADREGVVILDHARAGHLLAQCRSVSVANDALAATIFRNTRPIQPTVKIFIREEIAA